MGFNPNIEIYGISETIVRIIERLVLNCNLNGVVTDLLSLVYSSIRISCGYSIGSIHELNGEFWDRRLGYATDIC